MQDMKVNLNNNIKGFFDFYIVMMTRPSLAVHIQDYDDIKKKLGIFVALMSLKRDPKEIFVQLQKFSKKYLETFKRFFSKGEIYLLAWMEEIIKIPPENIESYLTELSNKLGNVKNNYTARAAEIELFLPSDTEIKSTDTFNVIGFLDFYGAITKLPGLAYKIQEYVKIKHFTASLLANLIVGNNPEKLLSSFQDLQAVIGAEIAFFEKYFNKTELHLVSWLNEILTVTPEKTEIYLRNGISQLLNLIPESHRNDSTQKVPQLRSLLKKKMDERQHLLPSNVRVKCTPELIGFYHCCLILEECSNLKGHTNDYLAMQKAVAGLKSAFCNTLFDQIGLYFIRLKALLIKNKDLFKRLFHDADNLRLIDWLDEIERIEPNETEEYLSFLVEMNKDIQLDDKPGMVNDKELLFENRLRGLGLNIASINRMIDDREKFYQKALAKQSQEEQVYQISGPPVSNPFHGHYYNDDLFSYKFDFKAAIDTSSLAEKDSELLEAMLASDKERWRFLEENGRLLDNIQIIRTSKGLTRIPIVLDMPRKRVEEIFRMAFNHEIGEKQNQTLNSRETFCLWGRIFLKKFKERVAAQIQAIQEYESEHGTKPTNYPILLTDEDIAYAEANVDQIATMIYQTCVLARQNLEESSDLAINMSKKKF